MEEIKVKEDLNDIVKKIKFDTKHFKSGDVHVCSVTLFNDVAVEFRDNDHVFDLLKSYQLSGQVDFIKSTKLVEELKVDEDGNSVGTYICVRYDLSDGTIIRLFTSKFNDNKIIENYYKLYKSTKKTEKPKSNG